MPIFDAKKNLKIVKNNHLASQLKNFELPLHAFLNYKAQKDHGQLKLFHQLEMYFYYHQHYKCNMAL